MYLTVAIVLFAAFFGNVLLGSLGDKAPLGDIPEMLLLAGTSAFFVAAILRAERNRLHRTANDPDPDNETDDPEVRG